MSKAIGSFRPLRIAVAAGKGGTGKTTLSVALALSSPVPAVLLDCDVEEPNVGVFLGSGAWEDVSVPIPVVDEARCSGCGACARVCEFKAIILLKKNVVIFSELCHSCGACAAACPEGAIREEPKAIGRISEWKIGPFRCIQGELNVGAAMSPPVIRAVKKRAEKLPRDLEIIDCPPGTSCPMAAAVKGADLVLMVTEPTPFGLHDLTLAVATVRRMGLPTAVVVNRCDVGDDRVDAYCKSEGIPVLARIPNDRRVAEAVSSGGTLLSVGGAYREILEQLHADLAALLGNGGAA